MTQPTSAAHQYTSSSGFRSNTYLCVNAAPGQVAAGGVQDALRLGGRAGRVEDEQRVLGVERLGLALVVGRLQRLVAPDVAPVLHRRVVVDVTCTTITVSIDGMSPRNSSTSDLTAAVLPLRRAPSAVISSLGVGELHPLLHRVGREAAEDHVVRGADARAGEHGHHHLGDHRQEDPHHVALLDAAVLQRVGQPLDVAEQVGVGDVALLALLAAPVEGHAVAVAGLHVAVEAVVRGVELAAREPLVERRVRVVERRVPLLEPVQRLGLLRPPGRPGPRRPARRPTRSFQQRLLGELGRRVERLLVEQLRELVLELLSSRAVPWLP